MSAFAACLKGQPGDLAAARWAKSRATKFRLDAAHAKFSVALSQNNLRFGLEGHPKFCHIEFRTVLLSYLTKQLGWIWRMLCAGPAFAATETGWS